MQNKTFYIIGFAIVFAILAGGYLTWQYFKPSEEAEYTKISEEIETPKIEEIENNDLMMDAIKKESGVSPELLVNSCVSSVMQETEDLILVYIDWNCADVGGGTRAILKKEDIQYKFIAMFQDPPSCALMEEFSVPVSFYESCYNN